MSCVCVALVGVNNSVRLTNLHQTMHDVALSVVETPARGLSEQPVQPPDLREMLLMQIQDVDRKGHFGVKFRRFTRTLM